MNKTSVSIKNQADGILVPATLISGVTIKEVEIAQIKWQEFTEKQLEQLAKQKVKHNWPEHIGWNWRAKYKKFGRSIAYKFYGIKCNDTMQGLLLLNTLFRNSRLKDQQGQQIIYGMYLEVAPWNLRIITKTPIYSLVGSVLAATAIQASRDEGCEGRFGLHSLQQSEKFYNACGMTDLGLDKDHDDELRYFEMTVRAANKFLGRLDQ